MLYVDAVCIKGETRSFNCTINTSEDGGSTFNPLDLSEYHVKFRVLGSPTSDSKVLLEKIITQDTLLEVEGQITVPANGEFVFTRFMINSLDHRNITQSPPVLIRAASWLRSALRRPRRRPGSCSRSP